MLKPRRDDTGAVAVFTVLIVTFVAMPLLALVVDLGISRSAGAQAATAADSAALAAAVKLSANPADQAGAAAAARQFVQDNYAVQPSAWAGCLDPHPLPAGTTASPGDCVSIDPTLRRVRVTVPARTVPSVFSGVLGTAPPAASATSTATWGPPAPACALCIVTSAGASGTFAGGIDQTQVAGGDVAVGGLLGVSAGGTLTGDPGRQITYGLPPATGNVSPPPALGTAPDDPLASTLAAVQAAAAKAPQGNTGACAPGIYADFSDCTSFTGNGVYVLTGNPYLPFVSTTVTLKYPMTNSVIYVTCSRLFVSDPQPQPCSAANSTVKPGLVASGSQTISGSSTFGGLALAFDPTAQGTQRLANGGTLRIDGSVDGPATTFRDSSSCAGIVKINGRLVAGAVTLARCTTTPGSPALTVTAPAVTAVPGGVRLVPSTP